MIEGGEKCVPLQDELVSSDHVAAGISVFCNKRSLVLQLCNQLTTAGCELSASCDESQGPVARLMASGGFLVLNQHGLRWVASLEPR
jgi:hypothetical protein